MKKTTPVASWVVSLTKLLEDPVGLCIFTEFLKQEVCSENVTFWIECENYRSNSNKYERKKSAKEIYARYLKEDATDAINIDSQSRENVKLKLEEAAPDLFLHVQKLIFNLMKFDCYPRFLKSKIFLSCLEKEKSGKPLQFQAAGTSESPRKSRSRSRGRNRLLHAVEITTSAPSDSDEDRKSDGKEEVEEKKRKSLLSWTKYKHKSTRKGRSVSASPKIREKCINLKATKNHDKSAAAKYNSLETLTPLQIAEQQSSKELMRTFRIIFPNSSAITYSPTKEELVSEGIRKIMKQHTFQEMAYSVLMNAVDELPTLEIPFSGLTSQLLVIERRILLVLQLPSRKIISQKARPEETFKEVLSPLLRKHGYNLPNLNLKLSTTRSLIDIDSAVEVAEKTKILVTFKVKEKNPTFIQKKKGNVKFYEEPMAAATSHENYNVLDSQSYNIEEMNQLNIAGKCADKNDSPGKNFPVDIKNVKTSETTYGNSSHETSSTEHGAVPKKYIQKNVHYKYSDASVVWSRNQGRLDDQRGTDINFDLPEFLKK